MQPAVSRNETGGRRRGHALLSMADHLFSFETIFALFIYSNNIKIFIVKYLPFDETIFFLALTVACGCWIIIRDGIYMRALPIVISVCIFFTYVVVSYAWSDLARFPKSSVIEFGVFVIVPLAMGALVVASDRVRMTRFLMIVATLGLLVALRGLWIYFEYGTFMYWRGWRELGYRRIYLHFGYTAGVAAAIWLALAMFSRLGSAKQLLGVVAFAICTGFVLISGARGALVGIAGAALFATFSHPPRLLRGRMLVSVPQLVVLVFVGVVTASLIIGFEELSRQFYTIGRLAGEVRAFFADSDYEPIVQGASRLKYWPAALEAWRENPLFGLGFKGFAPWFNGVVDRGAYPHNIVLQVLSELGLVGLGLFLAVIFVALRNLSLVRLREDRLLVATLMYGVAAAAEAMFAGTVERHTTFFLAVGLLTLAPAPSSAVRAGRAAVASPAGMPFGHMSVARWVRS